MRELGIIPDDVGVNMSQFSGNLAALPNGVTSLEQVQKEADDLYDRLVEEYKVKWNVTEELKKKNQIKPNFIEKQLTYLSPSSSILITEPKDFFDAYKTSLIPLINPT